MTFGDDVVEVLAEGRALALERMRRTCTVRVVTGVAADPTTGADVTTYGPPIYEGACRLRDRAFGSTDIHIGSAPMTQSRLELHIPWDSPPLPPGAVVTFTDATPAYRVRDTADGDDVTARRYPLEVMV